MPLLALEKVSKTYWSGSHPIPVLSEVSLSLEPGECLAVWGPRSSGKTTLLKLACGLEPPQRGTVRFANHDIHLHPRSRSRLLGGQIGWMLPPEREPRGLEALDYVALSLLGGSQRLRSARRISWQALACVGISQRAGVRCADLTQAERALLAIARSIAPRPSILLADDPAAHLDCSGRERVLGRLRTLSEQRGIAVLVTVPDPPSLVHSHRVASLSDGRLLTSGHARAHPHTIPAIPRRNHATG